MSASAVACPVLNCLFNNLFCDCILSVSLPSLAGHLVIEHLESIVGRTDTEEIPIHVIDTMESNVIATTRR